MSKAVAPWAALAIVGVAFAVAHISVSFIESGAKLVISNPLEIRIEEDHPPAQVIHYHIEKQGVWGL